MTVGRKGGEGRVEGGEEGEGREGGKEKSGREGEGTGSDNRIRIVMSCVK